MVDRNEKVKQILLPKVWLFTVFFTFQSGGFRASWKIWRKYANWSSSQMNFVSGELNSIRGCWMDRKEVKEPLPQNLKVTSVTQGKPNSAKLATQTQNHLLIKKTSVSGTITLTSENLRSFQDTFSENLSSDAKSRKIGPEKQFRKTPELPIEGSF